MPPFTTRAYYPPAIIAVGNLPGALFATNPYPQMIVVAVALAVIAAVFVQRRRALATHRVRWLK